MKIYHPLRWRRGDTEKKMLRVFNPVERDEIPATPSGEIP